jgi:hypothetical protein
VLSRPALAAGLAAAAIVAFGVSFVAGRAMSEPREQADGSADSRPASPALELTDLSRVAGAKPLVVRAATVELRALSRAASLPRLRPKPAPRVRSAPPTERAPIAPPAVTRAPAPRLQSAPAPTPRTKRARPSRRPVVIVGEG